MNKPNIIFSLLKGVGIAALIFTTACRSTAPTPPALQAVEPASSINFLDAKLLDLIEEEKFLNALAADPDTEAGMIQQRFQTLCRSYSLLLAHNPDSLEGHLLFAKLLANYGDHEGSRSQLLAAAKINPDIAVIHQQLGNYYAEEEDPTRAIAYYLNAIRLAPDVPEYHFGLGELITAFESKLVSETGFDAQKLESQMLSAFQKAAQLAPNNLQYQFRYGEAFIDQKYPDWQVALNHWTKLQSNPNLSSIQSDAVRLHRAKALVELGHSTEAREIADQVTTPGLFPTRDALFIKVSEE